MAASCLLSAFLLHSAVGAQQGPQIGSCPMFPADNVWNTPIDSLPVDPRSDAYVGTIGAGRTFHPDFGTVWQGAPNGIPYTLVPGDQPRVRVSFSYADESDPGPYPIPADAPIEGGPSSNGDRHVLLVDTGKCMLYELYAAYAQTDGSWKAGSGAIYDLNANKLRPSSWTSADAAGLPMLPGLVRFDEVDAGAINHALRFTAPLTQRAFVWPARHYASSNRDTSVPPMGERFRLKADFDISSYPPQIQVIFSALKTYGMMLADNGSPWYVSGAPDPRWDDDMLVRSFRSLHGSDFEAVDASSLMVDPSSAAAAFPG